MERHAHQHAQLGIVDFGSMFDSLRRAGLAGDLMLHGAASEDDIPRCLAHIKGCL